VIISFRKPYPENWTIDVTVPDGWPVVHWPQGEDEDESGPLIMPETDVTNEFDRVRREYGEARAAYTLASQALEDAVMGRSREARAKAEEVLRAAATRQSHAERALLAAEQPARASRFPTFDELLVDPTSQLDPTSMVLRSIAKFREAPLASAAAASLTTTTTTVRTSVWVAHASKIGLVIVVSGVPRALEVEAAASLTSVVARALAESGDTGRLPGDFELRTEDGTELPLHDSVHAAGLVNGQVLFLSPRAGAGD
jgi:hypothetical protein